MTMKRKQLQAKLEAVFPGLSFPRKRESIFPAVKHHFRTTSDYSTKEGLNAPLELP